MTSNQQNNYLDEDEIRLFQENTHSLSARKSYFSSIARFVGFLSIKYPELVSSELIQHLDIDYESCEGLNDNEILELTSYSQRFSKKVRIHIENLQNGFPVNFIEISPSLFISWVSKLRKSDGSYPGPSAYNTHKVAFKYFFSIHKIKMDEDFEKQLDDLFKGMKRTNAVHTTRSNTRLATGKDALDFGAYEILLRSWQIRGTSDTVFAHTFSILCWNLMCRSANCVTLCFNHIQWQGDCLKVYFAHSKTDQSGETIRYPRHIYANALNPTVCPILSLAVYLASFSIGSNQSKLFEGGSQYNRFSGILGDEVNKLKADHNEFVNVDLGTHSFRKGANTFCSSGSTAGPQSAAIKLRGGWTLGGSQDIYTQYQESGDRYVGRFLSGLPNYNQEFAMLPPAFDDIITSNDIKDSIQFTFSNIQSSQIHLAEYLLASLVYHSDYIFATFAQNHLLFNNPLFKDPERMSFLKEHVHVHNFSSSRLSATGIPPFASILYQLSGLKTAVDALEPTIKDVTKDTINGIVEELEHRSVQMNVVTYDGLNARLHDVVNTAIRAALDDSGIGNNAQNNATIEPVEPVNNGYTIYSHNNRLNMLPENYKIPSTSVPNVLHLFYYGDLRTKIPPLRLVTPEDFNIRNNRKRFSDLKRLVFKVIVPSDNIPSLQVINENWTSTIERYQIDINNRRTTQMSWRSANSLI
eukprot:NODE_596_length_5578_cov_0.509400.p1 type:complete len:695 gc:universal NODE_596_length_5578_cov_0.509400:1476-3560(+)